MMRCASTRVFLADDFKFGRRFLFQLCTREKYDYIVSNLPLPPALESAALPRA
ncbi:MAG: hypothetical protein IJF49_07665 [Clostridia bacterium]|nr:hypothetical protein [Clostridia bacterium]